MAKLRKRFLVTEGDLMQLFFEVEQIRRKETKELYRGKFKALLKDAEQVKLTVIKKGGNNG